MEKWAYVNLFENDFEEFDTVEKALERASKEIESLREEALYDLEWPEHVEDIKVVKILYEAKETNIEEIDKDNCPESEAEYTCDFEMKEI